MNKPTYPIFYEELSITLGMVKCNICHKYKYEKKTIELENENTCFEC